MGLLTVVEAVTLIECSLRLNRHLQHRAASERQFPVRQASMAPCRSGMASVGTSTGSPSSKEWQCTRQSSDASAPFRLPLTDCFVALNTGSKLSSVLPLLAPPATVARRADARSQLRSLL
jgi:hypothetical protein